MNKLHGIGSNAKAVKKVQKIFSAIGRIFASWDAGTKGNLFFYIFVGSLAIKNRDLYLIFLYTAGKDKKADNK